MGAFISTPTGKFDILVELSSVSHLDPTDSGANLYQIKRLLESWLSLLADSPLTVSHGQKPRKVFAKFQRDALEGPLLEFVKKHARLADRLVSITKLYGKGSITGPYLIEMEDTPVFKEYLHWFRTGDHVVYRYLLSFLYFGKKMKFEDEKLHAAAFRGWHMVEDRLSGLELNYETLASLKHIMAVLCPSIDIADFRPSFGPKAVAEKGIRGKIAKSNSLSFDARLDRVFFSGYLSNWGLSEENGLHTGILPDPQAWKEARHVSERVSVLRSVSKDVSKSRLICMEPNSFMYFQQAVQAELRKVMQNTLASKFIDIEDQSRNRALSAYGSRSGTIDTIDLSSASDSVSVDLVKGIFPRRVLLYLLGTRTSRVRLPDGTIVGVKKFAPMGSAVCFPTQCLIFTSVVILAAMHNVYGMAVGEALPKQRRGPEAISSFIRRYFADEPGQLKDFQFEPAAVYGDDICVDHNLTQTVIHLLTTLGFEVNTTKSFMGSQAFRESCGGYYYNGQEVTPQFFRIENFGEVMTPEGAESIIAMCNNSGDKGYRHLQRYLLHLALDLPMQGVPKNKGRNPVAFVDHRSKSYGVFSKAPRNTHLRQRAGAVLNGNSTPTGKLQSNIAYQRDEYQAVMITAGERIDASEFETHALERYLYQQWWKGKRGEYCEDFGQAAPRFDTRYTRLVRRWIPA